MPPKFHHDCDGCIFLGRSEDGRWDLYHCPRCDEGSVVARYGNEGHEYSSCPVEIIERIAANGIVGEDGARFPGSSPEVQRRPLVQALRLLRGTK